ncbi:aldo/keto reductase [Aquibacillus albus]|uniref:Aryl-alcohol dehydrogenase-like predicted oxidoreductase n=1 Tax=Aquibacillus albus TaxID=1168171 RepID=A0ABS2MWC4_9BACI|nr:aldo/keto reductase [Aquibacillus albus]MBM7570151.1 aryl-alcohol dehydrogenase-like predicted oxidoreductase [Aquibacillus albus]
MRYRKLGKTGLNVSVIGLGTWQFGGEWGKNFAQEEVEGILKKAKGLGINLIDTAPSYGDHLSERLIGSAIENNSREDWIIATKFGHKYEGPLKRSDCFSPQEIVQQLDQSLMSLKTDYVDMYQFHSGSDESFKNDELWTVLEKQIQAGKIRHLGISLKDNDNMVQTDLASQVKADVIQTVYNRVDRKPEEGVFPSCHRQNLGVFARVPLASGLLSGKYKKDTKFTENDVRHRMDKEEMINKLNLVDDIRRKEVPKGMDMAQWSLAWCLKNPSVTSVIPGCKNIEQVELNAGAADLQI